MRSNFGSKEEESIKNKVKDMKMAVRKEEIELNRNGIRNKSRR